MMLVFLQENPEVKTVSLFLLPMVCHVLTCKLRSPSGNFLYTFGIGSDMNEASCSFSFHFVVTLSSYFLVFLYFLLTRLLFC